MSLSSMKNKMITDLEAFAKQLESAQENIEQAKCEIFDIIQDKMKNTMKSIEGMYLPISKLLSL